MKEKSSAINLNTIKIKMLFKINESKKEEKKSMKISNVFNENSTYNKSECLNQKFRFLFI